MSETYNVYCDESGHLERDEVSVMVLGAIWCPRSKARDAYVRLREIKRKHETSIGFEAKWNKVSPARLAMYLDLIDYFFDDDDLHFRSLVVPDKSLLRHSRFGQSHDEWYFKMYYHMLIWIVRPEDRYRIFIDLKDTRSSDKVRKLHDVLANSVYDFSKQQIVLLQTVRSHEVELIQLADLLIGAVSYANRSLDTSAAKKEIVDRVRKRSGRSLTRTTLLREEKFNVFVWQAA